MLEPLSFVIQVCFVGFKLHNSTCPSKASAIFSLVALVADRGFARTLFQPTVIPNKVNCVT